MAIKTTAAECKAQGGPTQCPYHKHEVAMNTALANLTRDPTNSALYDVYYAARKAMEEIAGKQEYGIWAEVVAEHQAEPLPVEAGATPELLTSSLKETGAPNPVAEYRENVYAVDSPEVQRGEIVDKIVIGEGKEQEHFYRSFSNPNDNSDWAFPGEPYQIRIQANRKLSEQDIERMAGILGYTYRSTVVGESLGMPEQDTPFSFIVYADTTKSRRDDLGIALGQLEDKYPQYLLEGTPARKTKNNTRAIEGMNEEGFSIQFYYDSVYTENTRLS